MRHFIGMGLLVAALVGEASWAKPVEVEFSGSVVTVIDPNRVLDGSIVLGTRLVGTYQLEPKGDDLDGDKQAGLYKWLEPKGFEFELNLGNYTLGQQKETPQVYMIIHDDRPAGRALEDRYTLGTLLEQKGGPTIRLHDRQKGLSALLTLRASLNPAGIISDKIPENPPNADYFAKKFLIISSQNSAQDKLIIRATIDKFGLPGSLEEPAPLLAVAEPQPPKAFPRSAGRLKEKTKDSARAAVKPPPQKAATQAKPKARKTTPKPKKAVAVNNTLDQPDAAGQPKKPTKASKGAVAKTKTPLKAAPLSKKDKPQNDNNLLALRSAVVEKPFIEPAATKKTAAPGKAATKEKSKAQGASLPSNPVHSGEQVKANFTAKPDAKKTETKPAKAVVSKPDKAAALSAGKGTAKTDENKAASKPAKAVVAKPDKASAPPKDKVAANAKADQKRAQSDPVNTIALLQQRSVPSSPTLPLPVASGQPKAGKETDKTISTKAPPITEPIQLVKNENKPDQDPLVLNGGWNSAQKPQLLPAITKKVSPDKSTVPQPASVQAGDKTAANVKKIEPKPAKEKKTNTKADVQTKAKPADGAPTKSVTALNAVSASKDNPSTKVKASRTLRSTSIKAPKKVLKLGGGQYSLQVGAYMVKVFADELISELNEKGYKPHLLSLKDKDQMWYMVRIGFYPNRAKAQSAADSFNKKERREAIVRPTGKL